MKKRSNLTIERERGATYARPTFGVYRSGIYPRHSVLAGRPSRTFIDGGFVTVAEAKAAYPDAEVIDGTTHIPISVMTAGLPGEDL